MLGVEMNIRMLEERLKAPSSAWAIDVAASRGCSNGNRCPPGTLRSRNFGRIPASRTRRTTSDSAPPMNTAGTRRLRQVAHHVVRDGAVDLVLDRRVDLQPQLALLFDQPVAHVVVKASSVKSLNKAPVRKCARASSRVAQVLRRSRVAPAGRDAVDDAQALGRAEHAAAERPDDRRIEQHDGAEQIRAAHRGQVVEVAAQRVAHAVHRLL